MLRRSQRGQALVETALAAPLLTLLTLGLLGLGNLLWLRVRLQAAAHAAARAYAVWQPQSHDQALAKAREAGWIALRPQPRGATLQVEPPQWQPRSAYAADDHGNWLQGPLAETLTLRLSLAPWPGLTWLWPHGLTLQAPTSILSEDSLERAAADR